MWYIIAGIIIIVIICSILKWIFETLFEILGGIFINLSEAVGGVAVFVIMIAITIVSFFAFSWVGVLCVIGIGGIIALIRVAGLYIGKILEDHDKNKAEIVQREKEVQASIVIHDNDISLHNELLSNCVRLGYMNEEMWRRKLPNYANKKYSTNFADITNKFAMQIEQQNILQNDDWFQPFLKYIVDNPNGATIIKMLNEVKSPQLSFTHATPNKDILGAKMEEGTHPKNIDVPQLFNVVNVGTVNEGTDKLFVPTEYARKQYGTNNTSSESAEHAIELNFDDL